MSNRSDSITLKMMPNGNVRAYRANTPDKAGVSELQITWEHNIAPSVTTSSYEFNNLIIQYEMETEKKEKKQIQLPPELQGKKFRIRKLTERECLRLMDVDDEDIDKMIATGLSKSALYKLAGNSIVVNVLYNIFRKMFIETDQETQQLTLF